MKLKKWLLTGALCLSAVMLAVGCGGTGGGTGSGGIDDDIDPNQQIYLKIESAAPLRYNYNQLLNTSPAGSQLYNQALFTKKLVEGFAKKYPNIRLQFIENGWGEALYQTQQTYIRNYLQGGTLPVDIMIGETYMGYFAQNNLFVALDENKFSNVVEGTYSDMYINGKIYGVPMCTGIMGLQYNVDILREAGVAEDKWEASTWAELLENCKTVSEYAAANGKNYGGIMLNNVRGMSSAFRAVPFLRQAGGDIMKDGKLTLNSDENIAAFEYLRNLSEYTYKDSLTEESEDALQLSFIQGHAAYMIELAVPMAIAPDNIKSAPLPTKNADGTGVGNVFVGNVLFGIADGSKNKAAAQAFLEYLTSAEVQSWFYELDGRLPVNKSILESEDIRKLHPNINSYLDQLVAGGFSGGIACFTKNASDIWAEWGSFYSDVLRTSKGIKELADAAQSKIAAKM